MSDSELGFRILGLLVSLAVFLLGLTVRASRRPRMRISLWQVPLPLLVMLLLWWWLQLPIGSLYVMLGLGVLFSSVTYVYYRLVEARG